MSDVKSAKRVLDILELLSQSSSDLSLKQIGQSLEIPSSSCHALLETLYARGYVIRDGTSLTFRLSTKLFALAATHTENLDLTQVADPVMEQMSRLCHQTVSLAVLEGTEVVFIHKKMSNGVIRVFNPAGTRLPAHATALGKVILAESPPSELAELYANVKFKALTPSTITSKNALNKCLSNAREAGVAYDREESSLGLQAVAAAIRGREDRPVAAISIAVPRIHEESPQYWSNLEKLVRAGAGEISARLGCHSCKAGPDLASLSAVWQNGN